MRWTEKICLWGKKNLKVKCNAAGGRTHHQLDLNWLQRQQQGLKQS